MGFDTPVTDRTRIECRFPSRYLVAAVTNGLRTRSGDVFFCAVCRFLLCPLATLNFLSALAEQLAKFLESHPRIHAPTADAHQDARFHRFARVVLVEHDFEITFDDRHHAQCGGFRGIRLRSPSLTIWSATICHSAAVTFRKLPSARKISIELQ